MMPDVGHTLTMALDAALFRRSAFLGVVASPGAALAALWIPVAAGGAELAGQAFVLAARRVRALHAIASFALTGLVYVVAVALWTGAAHLLLSVYRIAPISTISLLGVVSLGYAPRLASAFTAAPYYGELLARALDAWSMACVGWGMWVVTGGPFAAVIACATLGWLGSHLLRHFGGRLTAPLIARVGLVTAGMSGGRDMSGD